MTGHRPCGFPLPPGQLTKRSVAAMRWVLTTGVGVAAGLVGTALALGLSRQPNVSFRADSLKVPMLGASVSDKAGLAQKTAQFGHMPVIRVYYPGLPGASAWASGVPGAGNSAVVVSFKAMPKAILSGADDAAVSHFVDTAPRNRLI